MKKYIKIPLFIIGGFFVIIITIGVLVNIFVEDTPEQKLAKQHKQAIKDSLQAVRDAKRDSIRFAKQDEENTRIAERNAVLDSTGKVYDILYTKSSCNIRSGPAISYSIVRKAAKGENLGCIGQQGKWYQLYTRPNKPKQWVHESVVLTSSQKAWYDNVKLKLLDWYWQKDGDWVYARGQVKNISASSLRNVMVSVDFQTKGGSFITSADALIKYNPILPGQVSSFEVMETYNPRMEKASISFITLFGETIPFISK